MNLTFEIYQSVYGYGFRVLDGSAVICDQPFKPGVPGFVGMSEAEAIAEAEAEIASREAPQA